MRWQTVLLLFLSCSANGQIQFPDSAAQWVYYYSTHAWEPEWAQHSNHRYFLQGDTTIENEEYKFLKYESNPAGITPDQSAASVCGFLRKDAFKVYYRHLQWFGGLLWNNPMDSLVGEVVLFDFSAGIGDTIYHCLSTQLGDTIYSVVTGLDSLNSDGNWYRTYTANLTYYGCHWQHENVEAYGSLITGVFGPLASCCGLDQSCLLFCFQSQQFEYNGYDWANCLNVGIQEQPNQAENCLTYSQGRLSSSCASPNSVAFVYDMTGRLVLNETYSNKGVDCSVLRNGIYLAVLQSENDRSVLKFAVMR